MKAKQPRIKKNFTLDPDIFAYVKRTARTVSASERVNQLLARGIKSEQAEKQADEARKYWKD